MRLPSLFLALGFMLWAPVVVAKKKENKDAADKPPVTAIAAVRPTQFAKSELEILYRADQLREMSAAERDAYMQKKAAQVVIGPGGVMYLVDGHQKALAYLRLNLTTMYFKVLYDWHDISETEFAARMQDKNRDKPLCHLVDEYGERRSFAELPLTLGELKDDPYRGLAWTVEKAGGYQELDIPYIEFLWGDFFRDQGIKLGTTFEDFIKAVAKSLVLASSEAARNLPGFRKKFLKPDRSSLCELMLAHARLAKYFFPAAASTP